jgi:hypothetical protein
MGSRQVRLTAVLKDGAGNPLSGKTISFSYRTSGSTSWTSAGSATTGSDGSASVTVSLTTPGTYDFLAQFAGDSQYEAASAQQNGVTIKDKASITLTITPL